MLPKLQKRLDRLERKHTDLLRHLDALTETQRTYKMNVSAWTMVNVMDHLVRVERAPYRIVAKNLVSGKGKRYSWTGLFQPALLNVILRLPFRFKVPARAQAVWPDDTQTYEEIRLEWAQVRNDWHALLAGVRPEQMQLFVYKHASGGWMTILQLLDFFEAHLDHHRQQFTRIEEAGTFPKPGF